MILTSPTNLQNTTKPYTVLSTWASQCDSYRFVTVLSKSVQSDLNSSELLVPEPLNLFQPEGFETETGSNNKLTTKVFLAFNQVYAKYRDYDFYLKADDDTFVNVDNLKRYLAELDPRSPATYGSDMAHKMVTNGYPSGGAGYVLSNRALELLTDKLAKNMSSCRNSGIEDLSK
jgi:glycoprotein-N-acetylgalactosamine 3-beta-galactosyltransferase